MLDRWFLEHPRLVGETYGEHQRHALRYCVTLFAAAAACFIHALVPHLFQRTASTTVSRLHREMSERFNRDRGSVSHVGSDRHPV